MMPAQLRDTTMKIGTRTLAKVLIDEDSKEENDDMVERLMGKKAELRFRFIQENAAFAEDVDI